MEVVLLFLSSQWPGLFISFCDADSFLAWSERVKGIAKDRKRDVVQTKTVAENSSDVPLSTDTTVSTQATPGEEDAVASSASPDTCQAGSAANEQVVLTFVFRHLPLQGKEVN